MAKKIVTAGRHEDFPELKARLSSFHGAISTAGKRRAERNRASAARTIQIDQEWELREIRSMARLQHMGRILKLCTARQSCARSYLQDTDCEMWAIHERVPDCPRYLLQVDRSTNEVNEFQGYNGSTPKVERSFACSVLRALDVSGDNNEAFARAGAFQALLNSEVDVRSVHAEGNFHRIWTFRDGAEVIIATQTWVLGTQWSRFLRTGAESTDYPLSVQGRVRRQLDFVGRSWNYLTESELLALALDYPSFAEQMRGNMCHGTAETADAV